MTGHTAPMTSRQGGVIPPVGSHGKAAQTARRMKMSEQKNDTTIWSKWGYCPCCRDRLEMIEISDAAGETEEKPCPKKACHDWTHDES